MNREEAKAKYMRREAASTTPAGSLCRNGLGMTLEKISKCNFKTRVVLQLRKSGEGAHNCLRVPSLYTKCDSTLKI